MAPPNLCAVERYGCGDREGGLATGGAWEAQTLDLGKGGLAKGTTTADVVPPVELSVKPEAPRIGVSGAVEEGPARAREMDQLRLAEVKGEAETAGRGLEQDSPRCA